MMYRFGNCVLDAETFELRRNGAAVEIEPQVFGVLKHLIENRRTDNEAPAVIRTTGAFLLLEVSVSDLVPGERIEHSGARRPDRR